LQVPWFYIGAALRSIGFLLRVKMPNYSFKADGFAAA